MSTPFQLALRSLGYFTTCETAEEYLEAEAEYQKMKKYREETEATRLTGKPVEG